MKRIKKQLFLFLIILTGTQSLFAQQQQTTKYEDKNISMRLFFRSPEQIAAFYIGRGFSQPAIQKIQQACFVTPIIKNKNLAVLWLELDNWTFIANGKPVKRLKRDYWKKQWQEINLPVSHQSTFGWTLLPEVRDLRADEGVGGSIILASQNEPFDLTAYFKTGFNKDGEIKKVTFKNIRCKDD